MPRFTAMDQFLSAKNFFVSPPATNEERLASQKRRKTRKKDHEAYMDFAELYADYVVKYEKEVGAFSNG